MTEDGLTDYERWQVAVAVGGLLLSVAFTLYITLKDDASVAQRLRWWRDQQRRKREAEAEFRRLANQMHFEAFLVVSGAHA